MEVSRSGTSTRMWAIAMAPGSWRHICYTLLHGSCLHKSCVLNKVEKSRNHGSEMLEPFRKILPFAVQLPHLDPPPDELWKAHSKKSKNICYKGYANRLLSSAHHSQALWNSSSRPTAEATKVLKSEAISAMSYQQTVQQKIFVALCWKNHEIIA